MILVHTGIRRGELFSLKWTDLDFENGVGYLKKTKSHKPRWFFQTPEIVQVLRTVPRIKDEDRIFCLYSPDVLTKAIEAAAIKAGIRDFRPHDLRHTFATLIRQQGAGLDVVQDLLGHSHPSQTRRYAHLGIDQLKEAAKSVEQIFAIEPSDPEGKGRVN